MKLYSLSDGLKRARKEAGITQAQLAKDMNVHIKTVMNWEQGVAEPSLGTLLKLTELYHCDLDYLTGRLDQKTHDLQFIHDQTGLSEKAIQTIQSLPDSQKDLVSRFIDHPDFVSAASQLIDLANKEALDSTQASLIVSQTLQRLNGKKESPVDGHLLSRALIYTLSTRITNMICDITDTQL